MKHILIVALLGLLVPSLAGAQSEFGDRRLKVLEDPLTVRFSGDADKISKAKLQAAIDIAALARDWSVVNQSDGRFELQTLKNGQHKLHVMVTYGDGFAEIRYIDSTEMMYKEIQDKGRNLRVIHGNYNVWIRELAETIGKRIGQPVAITAPAVPPPAVASAPGTQGNGNFSTRSFGRRGGGGGPALVHSRVVPPPSGFAAVDDVDKVPVREAGRDVYRRYLTLNAPKAFAVAEDGSWKMIIHNPDAIALALDHCEQIKMGCWLYAVDNNVVFTADPAKRISHFDQVPRASP